MAGTPEASQLLPRDLLPPPTFQTIESILNLGEQILTKPMVNVIGVVKDYQLPIKTKKDHKCTLTIVDLDTQNDIGIKVNIFGELAEMPHISGVGDVVILRTFKAQEWSGFISLLSNRGSNICVFHAAGISATALPKPSFPMKGKLPSSEESNYVTWLSKALGMTVLPDQQEFQERVERSLVVKDKFSILKDVKVGQFYNLIGEVIRIYENNGIGTVYLSDYSANTLFYNNSWRSTAHSGFRDGDEYGYSNGKSKAPNDWPGPYGKLSIQLTVFEPHLAFFREQTVVGKWVALQNVQIKMGNKGGCLEGFLRQDRTYSGRMYVQFMTRPEDPDSVDTRWKDALRRKKEYSVRFEKEKKEFTEEVAKLGDKRTSDAKDEKLNSKKRRKLVRETAIKKAHTIERKAIEKLELNANVKCNHADKATTLVANILSRHEAVRPDTGMKYLLPFVNTKYRADVRVVDFWPHRLEDFSVGRKVSEYDVLSDYSGAESTDDEDDMRLRRSGQGFGGEKKWEWRFSLQVEQARQTEGSEKFWLLVDNFSAQMLLDQDAVNLRQDDQALNTLREQMFMLWGDLEEKKTVFLKTPSGKALLSGQVPSAEPEEVKWTSRQAVEELPPDSDDENDSRSRPSKGAAKVSALSERDSKAGSLQDSDQSQEKQTLSSAIWDLPVTNKGFTCCIQQYGVKLAEKDEAKADAGQGYRWQRMFGMFGTMIDRPDSND